MVIKEKSPERLQAQEQSFAAMYLLHEQGVASIILRNATSLVTINMDEYAQRYRQSFQTDTQLGIKKERWAEIKFLEENIKTYNSIFEPKINEIKMRMVDEEWSNIPGYLSRGKFGVTFLIDINDKKYVAKIFHGNNKYTKFSEKGFNENLYDYRPIRIVEEVRVLRIEEKPVIFSYKDNVLIKEYVEGKDLTQLLINKTGEIPEFNNTEFKQILDQVAYLNRKGLMPDYHTGNLIYHPEKGFSFIDNMLLDRNEYRYRNNIEGLVDLIRLIAIFGKCTYDPVKLMEKGEAQAIPRNKRLRASLPVIVDFLELIKKDYPELIKKNLRDDSVRVMVCGFDNINEFRHISDEEFRPYIGKIREMFQVEK